MAIETIEVKKYPVYRWDEEREKYDYSTLEGYTVFSTAYIGRYTQVRAMVENPEGTPASETERVWFVEWAHKLGFGSASCRITDSTQRLTFPQAMALAMASSPIVEALDFSECYDGRDMVELMRRAWERHKRGEES